MDWAQYTGDPAEVFAAFAGLLERPAWHADAACREHPEVDWFPERGDDQGPAKAVCARAASCAPSVSTRR